MKLIFSWGAQATKGYVEALAQDGLEVNALQHVLRPVIGKGIIRAGVVDVAEFQENLRFAVLVAGLGT